MKNSKIEWTDHTFNPWIGCEPVSEGCRNCYAAALNNRFKNGTAELRGGRAVFNGTVKRTSAAYWKQPLVWNREAEKAVQDAMHDFGADVYEAPQRPRVFCASMADWLHEAVPVEWLADLLDLIRRTPNLDWLLLTKRPENFAALLFNVTMLDSASETAGPFVREWISGNAPINVWIGTSVEDQAAADARIPALLKIPARVRFLSCEPLLGAVDINNFDAEDPRRDEPFDKIHWVIAGGESGAKARPMHPDWVRGLRDQCVEAGVPFLFKQWGEWGPQRTDTDSHGLRRGYAAAFLPDGTRVYDCGESDVERLNITLMQRLGKAAAGRLLDGREWNEFPEAGKS